MKKLFSPILALFACLILFASCGGSKSQEPKPKYIVQVSIGHWKAPTFSAEQIIARLDSVSRLIPIEKVIIGWSLDKEVYRKVGAYLHEHDINMLLWLPLFAETEEVLDNSPAVDLWGRLPAEYAAGGFRFNCPTDPQNLANVIGLYDRCFSDCGFDGVFLDRVRTQSFVSGVGGVLNCGCPLCTEHFAAEGVDLAEVRAAWEKKGDEFLSVSHYDPVSGFEFADPLAADFFRAKGHIVSNSVAAVADSLHQRGLEVGLDLYAPFMAPFVGQDYEILSQHADFIKPMLYRMTFAPAGMGYEYDLLRKAIPGAKGYPDIQMDVAYIPASRSITGRTSSPPRRNMWPNRSQRSCATTSTASTSPGTSWKPPTHTSPAWENSLW